MVDGGPEGFAVVVAELPADVLRSEAQVTCGSGWEAFGEGCDLAPPSISEAALAPAVQWKLAVQARLEKSETQNATELRSYCAALVRAQRNRNTYS